MKTGKKEVMKTKSETLCRGSGVADASWVSPDILSVLCENMRDLVYVCDDNGNVLYLNAVFEEYTGRRPEEFIGKSFAPVFDGEDLEKATALYERTLKGNSPEAEISFKGTGVVCEYKNLPLKDSEGKIIGVIGTARDITERKRAEERIQRRERLYRTLFEAAGEAIFIYGLKDDGDIVFLDVNPSALGMFKGKREDFIGKSLFDVSPPFQEEERLSRNMGIKRIRAALAGSPQSFEWKHLRFDGTEFDAEVTLNRIELGEGHQIQGIVRDITERKRMEELLKEHSIHLEERVRDRTAELIDANRQLRHALDSLKKTEDLYHTIVEDMPEFITRWLPGGIVTFVNDNYCNYFSTTREEVTGRSFLSYIHKNDKVRFDEHLKVVRTENPVAHFEHRAVMPDGSVRWLQWTNRAIFDEHGEIKEFQSIGRDITERKKAEEEKARLAAQLAQSQKLEAVGTLAGGIAHDFNNIITVVKSLTDLILNKISADDPLRTYLKPISESAARGINLVQQLLFFSHNKAASIERVNLNDTSLNLISMLEHLISEDITLRTESGYGLWHIMADSGRMEQLITNLVINASEAMHEGGRVVLRTENIELNAENAKDIPGGRPGKFVLMTVQDSGVGMDEKILEHIFEPFFSTKGTNGPGMGLAIVYGIVKECNGWINVTSSPGDGTSFKVYLPAAKDGAETKAEKSPALKVSPGNGKRILLVEDEKWVRKSTALVLTEHGYNVFEAANAENAISLFYREKGRFDLVLSDVVMPGRNGLQLVGPLLDINPTIPILLSSAHLDDKAQIAQITKRGIPFIQKPYEIPDLLMAVEEAIVYG